LPDSRCLIEGKYVAIAPVVGFLMALVLSHGSPAVGLGVLALIAGTGSAERKIFERHEGKDKMTDTARICTSDKRGASTRHGADPPVTLIAAFASRFSRRQAQGVSIAVPMVIGSFGAALALGATGSGVTTEIAATIVCGATGASVGALIYYFVSRRSVTETGTNRCWRAASPTKSPKSSGRHTIPLRNDANIGMVRVAAEYAQRGGAQHEMLALDDRRPDPAGGKTARKLPM
jgi:hypothetical protein